MKLRCLSGVDSCRDSFTFVGPFLFIRQVNKEQAELCRDRGAQALKSGDYARAVKMLEKSLRLYPLGGVEALLAHAKAKLKEPTIAPQTTSSSSPSSDETRTGSDGRQYTEEQVSIVQKILRAKKSGRKAHYRVLEVDETATDNVIKKAYRKLSLKVHPDKNSAPQADEAFKAVSLAYATLSDENKRVIYDRYGDEDPDNRGGGMNMRHGGQEMSPEDIFNAFFGHMNGMPPGARGPGGVHFYTNGFGPGFHFQAGGPRGRQRNDAQQNQPEAGFFIKLLPFLFFLAISIFGSGGGNRYEGVHYSMSVCCLSYRSILFSHNLFYVPTANSTLHHPCNNQVHAGEGHSIFYFTTVSTHLL